MFLALRARRLDPTIEGLTSHFEMGAVKYLNILRELLDDEDYFKRLSGDYQGLACDLRGLA